MHFLVAHFGAACTKSHKAIFTTTTYPSLKNASILLRASPTERGVVTDRRRWRGRLNARRRSSTLRRVSRRWPGRLQMRGGRLRFLTREKTGLEKLGLHAGNDYRRGNVPRPEAAHKRLLRRAHVAKSDLGKKRRRLASCPSERRPPSGDVAASEKVRRG